MYKIIVWAILAKDDEILLLEKSDNKEWTAIGGHVEDKESLKMAIKREVIKQVGIEIKEDKLDLICIMDRELDDAYKLHIFFKTTQWNGQPTNKEPNIHSTMKWCKINDLPNNLGHLAAAAIESMSSKQLYHYKDHVNSHNKH